MQPSPPPFAGGPPICRPDAEAGQRWTFGFPGGLTAELHTRGARLHGLWVPDRHGTPADVVLAPRDPARTSTTARYFGATVGRYANRIAHGRFTLDGRPYRLTTQDDGHCLHGGAEGFDARIWEAEAVHTPERTGVLLHLHSPDGDQGFPGNLDVTLSCLIGRNDELVLSYAAVTDAATPVNLTNHAYFNLEGEGAGDVLDHELAVDATHYTPVDEDLIPRGDHRPVHGGAFDLRRPTRIAEALARPDRQLAQTGGYDHNFVLRPHDGDTPRRCAVLHAPATGRSMEVLTTEPGLQVYTAGQFDGTVIGKSGTRYRAGAGIALETQHFPDSPNRPADPSPVLRPGEEYRSKTVLRFTTLG
ncbi:aldose 1-epimerase [Streptomyces cinereoruber]|uniref:Aldose 1-epimerase n=1 Tax=Streptomyces cinereoruber TaxID=67260 RepID=A0AAV4KDB7_9ACTN|nr:aldose epimerase family protein [Streptomyces cinereoruber]MBB4158001.1 aldose 1-epimerase [Streptomyces cinereoruber]MBY8816094.1 galactose mutarotase [Streptomyces cinereoruber]NIH61846.1 aldose 1-epimerase [Streptomyces cinereoruber]QEV35830.1 galactose mutarotase [Streptomyces cinereoruber]GGR14168.1 aldose 1-epimerase [Streptomyces cinereoruber]